jgi:hypothetical protein
VFVVVVVLLQRWGVRQSLPLGAAVARSPKPAGDGGAEGMAAILLVSLSAFFWLLLAAAPGGAVWCSTHSGAIK